jgi:hypothetical protein
MGTDTFFSNTPFNGSEMWIGGFGIGSRQNIERDIENKR